VRYEVLSLDPATYRPHRVHGESRIFQETNCAADLWIEALHALGYEPIAAMGFTLSSDFDGDQWRMFKFAAEDLRVLFGVEFDEFNVWRPLTDHVAELLSARRMVTIDVDAWHLPDTAGLTYHCGHQKTTIMAQMIDVEDRAFGYFHNTSYYELGGDDFDALFGLGTHEPAVLPPYVETVRLDATRHPSAVPVATALELARDHLKRRPATNPVARLRKRLEEDLPWLRAEDIDVFHRYAFGTVRQCGANAELAADFAEWLGRHDGAEPAVPAAAQHFGSLASGMKSLEFLLARATRGRSVDLGGPFDELEDSWESAMTDLDGRDGH
jgi:hypothetical protein